MKTIIKILGLNFLPASVDLGLLLLRLGVGGLMLVQHGWGKLAGFSQMSGGFPDPLGIGSPASLVLAIAAEVAGSLLLIAGAFTRLAALSGVVAMLVAFFLVHGGKLSGEHSGEMALIYLVPLVVLFLSGGGRFAVDAKLAKAA